VIIGTLLIVSLAVFVGGSQFGLHLSLKFTLPLFYAVRWFVWGANQCRQRRDLRPFARTCARYSGLSLIIAGLAVPLGDVLRSSLPSPLALAAGIALCFVGGAIIIWSKNEFGNCADEKQNSPSEEIAAE